MPLLGRHKSAPRSPPTMAANTTTSSNRQHQVCESPLFGIRSQLALSGGPQEAAGRGEAVGGSGGAMAPSGGAAAAATTSELSSIPQQITRQQIHYAFSIMDTNQDGMIDLRDLSQMLANLGIPIDEAILSHIMSTVSKRGDHRISEAEFLDWISHLIEINDVQTDQTAATSGARELHKQAKAGKKFQVGRVVRSSTASSSLVADSAPNEAARTRRGSGSGLALMRTLSASATPSSAPADPQRREQQEAPADSDARDDLKAAFCVFDLDGDGYITLDEVRAGLKLLGECWSPNELRNLFAKCSASSPSSDLSSQQRISIEDFVQLLL